MTINKKPLDAEAGELDGTQGGTKQQYYSTTPPELSQVSFMPSAKGGAE